MPIILEKRLSYSSSPRWRVAFIHTTFQKGWEGVLTQLLKKLVDGWRSDYRSFAETLRSHQILSASCDLMVQALIKGLMGHTITQKLCHGQTLKVLKKGWGPKQESQQKSTLATYSTWFGILFLAAILQVKLQLFNRKHRKNIPIFTD